MSIFINKLYFIFGENKKLLYGSISFNLVSISWPAVLFTSDSRVARAALRLI